MQQARVKCATTTFSQDTPSPNRLRRRTWRHDHPIEDYHRSTIKHTAWGGEVQYHLYQHCSKNSLEVGKDLRPIIYPGPKMINRLNRKKIMIWVADPDYLVLQLYQTRLLRKHDSVLDHPACQLSRTGKLRLECNIKSVTHGFTSDV